jgi:hypothetical protein
MGQGPRTGQGRAQAVLSPGHAPGAVGQGPHAGVGLHGEVLAGKGIG